jgi:type II secretion system (T2SS) protein M
MKWSAMSARDRRAVIYGAIVLLPGLLYIWAWRPYRAALGDTRDQLAIEGAALARERAAVATARQNPRLQHIADSVMRAMRPRLFEGKDDVMASAELASYVGDVARKSRVWLQDAGTRPAAPASQGVRTLRVEIRAESDLVGALMFIQSLERGEKLVRIERLDISRAPRANENDSETLSIAATISGFAAGESAAASLPAPRAAVAAAPAGMRQ